MKNKKHYVIGDVHGEYKTLLALVDKLPSSSELIFVGDLVDRGSQSREVIAFIRKHNYQVVLGNHEDMMMNYGKYFLEDLIQNSNSNMDNLWIANGGDETLISYGLLLKDESSSYYPLKKMEEMAQLQSDLEWLTRLPLYIELDITHSSGKSIVVSHSNILKVWKMRNISEKESDFKESLLWSRDEELVEESDIFNIYGHTVQNFEPKITESYINIDTGCCYNPEGDKYGRLTAYCIETGEIIIQESDKVQ